jgi:single-stranded DNA-binding protein
MSGVNRVLLLGAVTSKPEFIENDKSELEFELTTIEEINRKSSLQKHTEIHHIRMKGELAVTGSKMIVIGQFMHIEGKIKTKKMFVDNHFQYRTCIIAGRFDIMHVESKHSHYL